MKYNNSESASARFARYSDYISMWDSSKAGNEDAFQTEFFTDPNGNKIFRTFINLEDGALIGEIQLDTFKREKTSRFASLKNINSSISYEEYSKNHSFGTNGNSSVDSYYSSSKGDIASFSTRYSFLEKLFVTECQNYEKLFSKEAPGCFIAPIFAKDEDPFNDPRFTSAISSLTDDDVNGSVM